MRTHLTTEWVCATAIGGADNPNCFSLARDPDDVRGVRIVNMKLGPFERVAGEFLTDGRVEVEMLSEFLGLIVDPRVPAHELTNDRWCPACCPFVFLPEDQQRERLKHDVPLFNEEGRLAAWRLDHRNTNTAEEIEAFLRQLRASGGGRNGD